MGKRIIPRARGKGGPRYRAPSHRWRGKVQYLKDEVMKGKVKDIINDPGRSAPVAIVRFENGEERLHIAAQDLHVGERIEYGGEVKRGNVMRLADLPVGTQIFAIETYPNSGPKMCRSSGTSATVVSIAGDKAIIQLSASRVKHLNSNCRATVGVAAGGGRLEKPILKAGKMVKMKAPRGKLYPRSLGVAMSAVDHPYGGSKKAPRPSRFVSRHAPPGAKVGSISPRRHKKRRKK